MSTSNRKTALLLIAALTCAAGVHAPGALAQQARKPFTIPEEIGLTFFGGGEGNWNGSGVSFSPDGNYVAVHTERGLLELNCVEDSLRFYGAKDIESFLANPQESQPPSPIWVLIPPMRKEGSIINSWRWLPDSSGVAYLERSETGTMRLMLADLKKRTAEPLTSETENVNTFEVRDRQHFVFTGSEPEAVSKEVNAELAAPAIVATGRSIQDLLFPADPQRLRYGGPSKFWAVIGGKRTEVKSDGIDQNYFALSPDGHALIVRMLLTPPPTWKTVYLPAYEAHPFDDLREGKQVHEYSLLNLETGASRALTDAPISENAGWGQMLAQPGWSSDGHAVLLPGTFLNSKEPAPPCVAVVDLSSNTRECVWTMKRGRAANGAPVEKDYRFLESVGFANGDKRRVTISYEYQDGKLVGTTEYRRAANGTWEAGPQVDGMLDENRPDGLAVHAKQWFDEPPRLVASKGTSSRVLWDPNPQLAQIELGPARVFNWKSSDGRPWKGGLYLPPGHKPGRGYPLVIQTHGFGEWAFLPSGLDPQGFAARALAGAGIAVLQANDEEASCPMETPDEAPCMVVGYEAAVKQLASEGIIDPENLGIIGFSRTGIYAMEALTASSLHFHAALIEDTSQVDYLEYLLWGGSFGERMIGAKPFGEGLQTWLKRSPGFNLDKVHTPLRVVPHSPLSLLGMWQPYAGLRALGKPVDLILLKSEEHVLTNPVKRLESQGGSVDWFRFWMQGYEDPNPDKAVQYKRWRGLRELQAENDKKSTAAQTSSSN